MGLHADRGTTTLAAIVLCTTLMALPWGADGSFKDSGFGQPAVVPPHLWMAIATCAHGSARGAADGACLVALAMGCARLVFCAGPDWRRTVRAMTTAAALGAVMPDSPYAPPGWSLGLSCACAAWAAYRA